MVSAKTKRQVLLIFCWLLSIAVHAQNITAIEYFFDADPGYGAGTSVSITPAPTITNLTFNVNVAAIADGFHTLFVRTKDANNNWSAAFSRPIYKLSSSVLPPLPNINKLEYFIGADPGYGNGVDVPITPTTSITNQNMVVPVGTLAEGSYPLTVRARDANNNWSIVFIKTINVCNHPGTTVNAATAITNTGFTASWADVPGSIQYQLDVSTDNFSTFVSGYNSRVITAPALSSVVTGLSQATAYQYRVRAVSTCASVESNTISVTTLATPPTAQPTNMLFSSVTATTLTAFFTAPSTAPTGYLVVRKAGSASAFTPSNNTTYTKGFDTGDGIIAHVGSAFLFNETGLTPNTQYFYRVFAYNQFNGATSYLTTSPLQNNVRTVALEPTAQPTNLQFTSVTDVSFTVGFTAATGTPDGYLVLRKTGSAPTGVPVDGTTYTTTVGTDAVVYQGNATSFAQTGLTQNTEYFYTIYAFNGTSSAINYRTISPLTGSQLTPITPPATGATNMVFSNITPTAITVSYTAPAIAPSGYLAVRKAGASPTFVPQANTSYTIGQTLTDGAVAYVGTARSFSDTGLTPSTLYFYDVFVYNQVGSLISYQVTPPLENSVSTFTGEPTAQPSSISFNTITTSSLNISFSAASPAPTGYLILRKAGSAPTSVPVDGTAYTVGNAIGDGTIVFIGSSLTASDAGLTAGTSYFYQVFSYNGTGIATNYLTTVSSANSGSTITVPGKPVANAATVVQQNQFTANWAATTGAASYRLDVSLDNFATRVSGFNDLTVTSTSVNVTGLNAGTTYQYRVRAVNASGVSVNSDPISQITVPSAPTLAAATNTTQTSFTANWNAVTGATGYFIDVSLANDFSSFITGFQNRPLTNVTTLAISSLSPGVVHYYRIRATNAGGTSANSALGTQLLLPATPVGLDATNATSTSFKAKWQVATGASEYRIDVSLVSSNFNPSLTAYTNVQVTGSLQEFLVTGLIANTAYQYQVRAVNASGTSPNSSPISVSTLDANSGNNSTTLAIPTLSSGGTMESYRMFSIPLSMQTNSIAEIFSILGAYSKDKWRLLRWNQSKNGWDEVNNGLTTIDRGSSYWYNATAATPVVVTGTDYADPSFTLQLARGWNQIGSPYNFNIDWTDVLARNTAAGVDATIFSYDPAGSNKFKQGTSLNRWSGAYVFSSTAVSLTIPRTVKQGSGRMQSANESSSNLASQNWTLPLKLSVNNIENSFPAVGMHTDASLSYDRFDMITLPRFGDYAELHANHPDFFAPQFTKDIVPNQPNYIWHLNYSTSLNAKLVTLSWDQNSLGMNDAVLLLYDPQLKVLVDMKKVGQYHFEGKNGYRVDVFFATNAENFRPDISTLVTPYPNPMFSQVSIPFFVSQEKEPVSIAVYDVLGKKIKTVVNGLFGVGLQYAEWNGEDDQGNRVVPGVYVYRYASGSGSSQNGRLIVK
jgi:hypothetical protein